METFAEPIVSTFDVGDDEMLEVKQVRISLFGYEYMLDPDQAETLVEQIKDSLKEME